MRSQAVIDGRRKVVLVVVSIAVSLAAVGWFVYRLRGDWGDLLGALQQAQYLYLVPAIGFVALSYVFRVLRWRLFLSTVARAPMAAVISATLIGFMSTAVLPLRAGEVIRPYVLHRRGNVSFGHAVGTDAGLARVFDMLFGVGFLFLLAWGWMVADPSAVGAAGASGGGARALAERAHVLATNPGFMGLFVLSLAGLLTVAVFPRLVLRIGEVVLRVLPARWEEVLLGFLQSVVESLQFLRSPVRTLGAVLLTLGVWSTYPAAAYCLALGFGMDLTPLAMVVIQAILTVAIIVPQAPGFLGVFQAAVMEGARLFGADKGAAGAFAIVLWAVHTVPITLVGLGCVWYEGLSLGGLARAAADASEKEAGPAEDAGPDGALGAPGSDGVQ